MNINQNKLLEQALKYQEQGLSIFPVGRNKRPLINEWKPYQTEKASKMQVEEWWEQFPNANIAIVTGKISNLVVIDVDVKNKTEMDFSLDIPEWLEKYSDTYQAKTSSGGRHYYFHYPENFSGEYIHNSESLIHHKVDVRGEGGYVVAPPSVVEFEVVDGQMTGEYVTQNNNPIQQISRELYDRIIQAKNKIKTVEGKTDWKKFLDNDNGVGTRNSSAAKLAGKLLHHIPKEFWELTGWSSMKEWNDQTNNPKLSEEELRGVWDSILQTHLQDKNTENDDVDNSGKKSQASLLVEEIEKDKTIFLFHDESNSPYIKFEIDGHQELCKARSKQFKSWLGKTFWDNHQKAPNSDAINTALNVIDGKCNFAGPEIKLANRVAWLEDSLWYDLTDKKWRAVKITAQGWTVVNVPPILFRRYSHQQEQVEPVTGGDVKDILKYVNIQNEKQKILFLVYVVSCFIPDFPHPVLNIYGAQGSAKSSLSKVVRKIVDPSILEVTEFPKNPAELIQKLSHHWLLFFDNVSNIPPPISDILCRVVTGSGFSKRELFTDDEDIIYLLKRCIGINGINLTSEKADLLERSILLELQRFPKENRREETELFAEFELNRGKILGGIFDALVKALQIKPNIKLRNMPRMADFAVWGCAISEALGYSQQEFLDAYDENIADQNNEVLSESFAATALISFMELQEYWADTPSILLSELKREAQRQGINVDSEKSFPKAANTLSKELNLIKPNLLEAGIKFSRGTGKDKRLIYLQKVAQNTVSVVPKELKIPDSKTDDSSNDTLQDILDFSQTQNEDPLWQTINDSNDNF